MVGIYKISNPNGRIYIGQSTNIELSNINANCNNKVKSAGGFIWKFKEQ
jgi:hypothetical protein